MLNKLKEKVLAGENVSREEALALVDAPLDELCAAADEIRAAKMGKGFDLCTIINAKSGRCSENCRFCAQSAHNHTGVDNYDLLDDEAILEQARRDHESGVLRFSIVTAGRALSDDEVARVADVARRIIDEVGISVCVSAGLLTKEQFTTLYDAGVRRVHNNLEAARDYFSHVCTSHSFDDKVAAIRAAQEAGMNVCSGGIMGLGESWENRIDMALSLRDLGIRSVPVNMLNPIPGTPFANNARVTEDELRRVVALYRFILPEASIRLAGGRGLLADKGEACFRSGANAAISGDMLTTQGITTATDLALLDKLGYEVKKYEG